MSRTSQVLYALSFFLAAAGVLLPLWPLCVVGIGIAAFSGRWIFAVLIGLLIDVVWGAPQGVLHMVYVPFTIVSVLAVLARYFLAGYFFDRNLSDTL